MIDYLLLILGLLLLAAGGDWLVKGGVSLARRINISPMVIGVTIISFGTSAPELVVSINAALTGHPAISIGNVVGSNISNIALVLGLTVLLISIPVKQKTIKIDWSVMMIATLMFFLFLLNESLEQWEGIVFVAMLMAYIFYSLRSSRMEMRGKKREKSDYSTLVSIIIVVVSIVSLLIGSNFLIRSASNIAASWGVSERVISISVIALGTSLPELATAVMAARRNQLDISVGNLIGSNIFNIFGILGITAIVRDISVDPETLSFDWYWMVGICLLLLIFMLPTKKAIIKWWKGVIFLLVYFAYYALVFLKPAI